MKLYAVLLGGSGDAGRLTEDHETVFVVARSEKEAKRVSKTKWGGVGRAHVDAIQVLDAIDGFAVTVQPGDTSQNSSVVSYNDAPHEEEGSSV